MDNLLDYFVGVCCARSRKDVGNLDSDSDHETFTEAVRRSIAVESVVSEAISHPEKEGYLSLIDTFKGKERQCYFVLKNDLFYFEQKDDYIPIGASILSSHRMIPEVESCTNGESQFCFRVLFPGECIFKMESNEEVSKWRDLFITASQSKIGSSEEILQEGYLHSLGPKNDWDRYFFVLYPGVLKYFLSSQEKIPLGIIPLTFEYVRPEPLISIPKEKGNILSLFYCATLTVATENFEEQQSWIAAIGASISSQENEKTLTKKPPLGWKRPGRVKEVVSPLIDILRDPLRVEYFRQFVREVECEHYLLFWLEVQQFRKLLKKEDKAYLQLFVQAVCNKYVQYQKTFELDPVVAEIKLNSTSEGPTANTFRDGQIIAFQALRDLYPLFIVSSHAEQMAKAVVNNS